MATTGGLVAVSSAGLGSRFGGRYACAWFPGLSPSKIRFPASDLNRWLKSRRGDFDQRFATSARRGRYASA